MTSALKPGPSLDAEMSAVLTEAKRLILAVDFENPADHAECVERWLERVAALEAPKVPA